MAALLKQKVVHKEKYERLVRDAEASVRLQRTTRDHAEETKQLKASWSEAAFEIIRPFLL